MPSYLFRSRKAAGRQGRSYLFRSRRAPAGYLFRSRREEQSGDCIDPINMLNTNMESDDLEDTDSGGQYSGHLEDNALKDTANSRLNRQLRSRSYLFRTKKDHHSLESNVDESLPKVVTRGAYLFRT